MDCKTLVLFVVALLLAISPGSASAEPLPAGVGVPADSLRQSSPLDLLTSGEDLRFVEYSAQQAAELDVPFLAGKLGASQQVVAYEWSRYLDVLDEHKKPTRVGVSVQLILRITRVSSSARTNSLGLVAASASVGWVRADAFLRVRGATSDRITQAMPRGSSNFDADNIHDWLGAVDDIRGLVLADDTTISPQILVQPKAARTMDPMVEAVGVYHAIQAIADEDTLEDALDDVDEGEHREAIRQVVLETYASFCGIQADQRRREPAPACVKRAAKLRGAID